MRSGWTRLVRTAAAMSALATGACRKMGVDGDGGGKVVFMMSPEAAMRRRGTRNL